MAFRSFGKEPGICDLSCWKVDNDLGPSMPQLIDPEMPTSSLSFSLHQKIHSLPTSPTELLLKNIVSFKRVSLQILSLI